MIVNGKNIADRVLDGVREKAARLKQQPRLTVFACAPNFETKKYLEIKKRKALQVGVQLNVQTLPPNVTEDESIKKIKEAAADSDGIIVQLPFPPHINAERLIGAIPQSHDVDAFTLDDTEVLPPVVGAIREILNESEISIEGKNVVIVGDGKLVGRPASKWFTKKGAHVEVVTEDSEGIAEKTQGADIIVLGAGSPGLLKPEMIKEGVVILDAGTSEEGGELRGDADPRCAEKAVVFTPVPGGIGPITIAVLLRNLVILASRDS